jgi:AbrB family looped-hinge helix DNA binding protein
MRKTATIDKAGRLVLPKRLRNQMRLEAGDDLLVESVGDTITLRPIRRQPALKKELGVWVYEGERTKESIPDLIDQAREERIRELLSPESDI